MRPLIRLRHLLPASGEKALTALAPRSGERVAEGRVRGLPLITLSLLGMLAAVEFISFGALRLDAAVVLIFAAGLYMTVRDWRLGLAILGLSMIVYIAAAALPLAANVILFGVGLLQRARQLRVARH